MWSEITLFIGLYPDGIVNNVLAVHAVTDIPSADRVKRALSPFASNFAV